MKLPAICLLATAFFLVSNTAPLNAKARRPEPGTSADVYSLSKAEPVPIAAKTVKLPLVVFGEEPGLSSSYTPSGFMGDSISLKIKSADFSAPLSSGKPGVSSLRIEVYPKGREGWAGVYWQTPANNWGKIKGAGYDLSKATKLTFWARGEKGGERINEFKLGGLMGPYPDTDTLGMGPVRLNKEWTQYTIDLKGKDMRHIIGGFAFGILRADNPRGAVFYIDEIIFQGEPEPVTVEPVVQVPEPSKSLKVVVPFATSKGGLTAENRAAMDELADAAVKSPEMKVVVVGHTDNVGPKFLNKRLSLERAKAVKEYLVTKGVPAEIITVDGSGDEQPIREGSNDTAEGRKENRRVEISLVPK